jgi:DNA-directed RNA polymerase specialized sigma24 family protein
VAVFQELLLQLLGRVPEEKRDWIVMRLQGYSVAEISAEVGRTERAVYRLLDRSRQLATEMELDHFG